MPPFQSYHYGSIAISLHVGTAYRKRSFSVLGQINHHASNLVVEISNSCERSDCILLFATQLVLYVTGDLLSP